MRYRLLKKEDVRVGDSYYADSYEVWESNLRPRESIELIPTVITAIWDFGFGYQKPYRFLYKIVPDAIIQKSNFIKRLLRSKTKEKLQPGGVPIRGIVVRDLEILVGEGFLTELDKLREK